MTTPWDRELEAFKRRQQAYDEEQKRRAEEPEGQEEREALLEALLAAFGRECLRRYL
jgi:hypothetical protein